MRVDFRRNGDFLDPLYPKSKGRVDGPGRLSVLKRPT